MADSPTAVKVSGPSRRVMESLFETIIPSEGPQRPGALDVNLVDRLLKWLQQLPGAPAGAFVLVCWMWEFAPIWSGRLARLSRLPLEDRIRILEGWKKSRLFIRRWPFFLTRVILLAGFYSNPELWPRIGYEPGCLAEPPNPVEN